MSESTKIRGMQVKQIKMVRNILENSPVIDNQMAKELDELKAMLNRMDSKPRVRSTPQPLIPA